MPLQGLASVLLSQTTLAPSLVFWALHWYEPVLVALLIINAITYFCQKRKLDWSIVILSTTLLFGFISVLFISPSISLGLEGFRFTLLGLVFLLIALLLQIDKKQVAILIKIYLIIAVVLSVWAILERFLPTFYWDSLKISLPISRFGWGYYDAGGWLQSTAFSVGPNQLASYLLPAFFILMQKCCPNVIPAKAGIQAEYIDSRLRGNDKKEIGNQFLNWLYPILIIVAIAFTLSRSAAVGLCAVLLIWFLLYYRNKIAKLIVIAVIIIFGAIILINKDNATINNFLTHGNQTGHQSALQITMDELHNRVKTPAKLLFGAGLGTAGPIEIKYNSGIVSESWYFQLVLELGIVGLIFWLAIISILIYKLSKNSERGFFFGIVAVSVTALFLHTFADNPALTYTLFIIIGIKYFGQDKVKNSKEANV